MKLEKFTDEERELFGQSIRKLLTQSFIMAKTDSVTYNFLRNHEDAVYEYLNVIGYQMMLDSERMVIGLEEMDYMTEDLKYNFKEKLKKTHSALLACIWKLYIKRVNEFADPDEMWFEIRELKDLMQSWNLYKKDLSNTEIEEAFRLFSKHNLIKVLSDDIKNPNARIQMYPSLAMCVKTPMLTKIASQYAKEYGVESEGENKDE